MVVMTFKTDENYRKTCELLSEQGVPLIGDNDKKQLFFLDPDGVYTDPRNYSTQTVNGICYIDEIDIAQDMDGVPNLPAFMKPLPGTVSVWELYQTNADKDKIKKTMMGVGVTDEQADAFITKISAVVSGAVQQTQQDQQAQKKKRGRPRKSGGSDSNKFATGTIAQLMIDDYKAKYFRDGFVRAFDGSGYGSYEDCLELIDRECLAAFPNCTQNQRREVYKTLLALLKARDKFKKYEPDSRYIRFKNCLYNLETGATEDFSEDKIVTNLIPHDYNQSVKVNATVDKFFYNITCGDDEIKELLLQFMGYCMYSDISAQKAFILTGRGANGKSTFLDTLREMVGEDNTSELMLKEFSNRFSKIRIVGKLVNIGDDIDDKYVDDPSYFKILSAGGRMTIEQKFMDPVSYTSTAKMIFSTNNMPKINDHSDAIIRRLEIVPFKAKFDEANVDYDPHIGDKLAEESAQEYLIVLAVAALRRFLAAGSVFSRPKAVTEANVGYSEYNNPIIGFINEYPNKIAYNSCQTVYKLYKAFCIDEGIRGVLGKKTFNAQLAEQTKLVKAKVNNEWGWYPYQDEDDIDGDFYCLK